MGHAKGSNYLAAASSILIALATGLSTALVESTRAMAARGEFPK